MTGQTMGDSAKYLVVNISKDMRWTEHRDTITAKANSKLGFIKRNININNWTVKDQAYKSLVRPILEYSQLVCDPYTATDIQQLESVQRRAAQLTVSRYRRTSSVGSMLEDLNREPLVSRRRTARLVFYHKICHATRTEAQFWANLNRKLPVISHSFIISKEFIFLPHSQRLELSYS